MFEERVVLERATFKFTQESNCISSSSDEDETLTIDIGSSLGIDRDEGCFFVLKTKKWSVDNEQEFKLLFDRIKKIIKQT